MAPTPPSANAVQTALLDVEDIASEIRDCARHGDDDAVRHLTSDDMWGGGGGGGDTEGARVARDKAINAASELGGNTALHMACANGHAAVARLLLARGARADVRNGSGNTPLHWAALNGCLECAQVLLSGTAAPPPNGASAGDGGGDGGTVASETPHDSSTSALARTWRVDPTARNAFERTALDEAQRAGHRHVCEHLLEYMQAHSSASAADAAAGEAGHGDGNDDGGDDDNEECNGDDDAEFTCNRSAVIHDTADERGVNGGGGGGDDRPAPPDRVPQ